MSELKIGTKIKDRYVLREFKGSGSFGEVWLAHDEVLDSDVAIKIYISLDPCGVEEFKSEYTTTQGIAHPNLLTATYFDVWEQRPFLVMKYCPKGSSSLLATHLDEYTLWQFIHDVSSGLEYLHSQPEPIIHQDIKPDNILVDDNNRFLITDFGISKKIRSTMRKQSKRAVGAGATAYMGPERFTSDPTPVKASDIWSLGASIYELASGILPFSGLGGGMQRNGAEMPSLDNKWSKELNLVMQACLAKETWNRPTAKQLAEYASAILEGREANVTWNIPLTNQGVADESTASSLVPPINMHRKWYIMGSIIIVILLVTIYNKCVQPNEHPNGSFVESDSIYSITDTIDDIEEDSITAIENDYEETTLKLDSTATIKESKETKKDLEKTNPDKNAELLKKALTSSDYKQVQLLANQGYAAAYAPLAKYYLNNHDYSTAEKYAKKAKAAGFQEGTAIIKTLENLGYYD